MNVTTPNETASLHKHVVTEMFSAAARYWRHIYEEPLKEEATFMGHEIRARRLDVLNVMDIYAENRKLSVLDSGCGAGITLRNLLSRGHRVVGTDITRAMLEQAHAGLNPSSPNGACCSSGDVERLPFKDDSFDAVVCMGVLQYLQTDDKAIREISRVVRDRGLVIVTVPNLFKISNFLDPYYYLVRWLQFVASQCPLFKRHRRRILSPDDFDSNAAFANRRYYHGQLSPVFTRHGLLQVCAIPIAFGPPTFWRKPLLPTHLSIQVSECVRQMALKRYFRFLIPFANRWVIGLTKDRSRTIG